jgi:RNA polymerase sigma-70 factor (ECF subfamily)
MATGGSPPSPGCLRRIVDGDQAAFRSLVKAHYGRVLRLAARLLHDRADAEDVAQEAFLKLWREGAGIRKEASVPAWLMKVTSNLALDRLRRPKAAVVGLIPDRMDERAAPDRDRRRADVSRVVDEALAGLPERQRLALVLVHFEGCEQKVAAAAMDVSIEALESLLARARRALKAALRDEWPSLLAEIEQL